jgi:hypothetical protein
MTSPGAETVDKALVQLDDGDVSIAQGDGFVETTLRLPRAT